MAPRSRGRTERESGNTSTQESRGACVLGFTLHPYAGEAGAPSVPLRASAALSGLCVWLVSASSALRPVAKRILANALSVRREARRIAAESREAYDDLIAEVMSDAEGDVAPRTSRIHAVPISAHAEQPLA